MGKKKKIGKINLVLFGFFFFFCACVCVCLFFFLFCFFAQYMLALSGCIQNLKSGCHNIRNL